MTLDAREQAIRRIRAKREFRTHLTVYVAVNALLVLIWFATGAGYFWPMWPILGWGIAIAIHAVTVYMGTSEITEAEIDDEMRGRSGS
jgi:hypothetical protein